MELFQVERGEGNDEIDLVQFVGVPKFGMEFSHGIIVQLVQPTARILDHHDELLVDVLESFQSSQTTTGSSVEGQLTLRR